MFKRLANAHLRIVEMPWKPYFVWKCPNDLEWSAEWQKDCPDGGEKMYGGTWWELLLFMQHAFNFTFTFVKPIEVLWGGTCYNAENCTGIFGMLTRDEADVAIGIS